ncbi:hypothetical protein CC86DRAFT_382470 [Ophiobolus disseminans]|uniref:Uncharacterized protein n=1 Tax=Ophiobolus disseminans TaxID=1469910 RepID=A0A6A7A1L1_9PLEO|nr:hypothetical protein CC86DRAFT_382470 [Ophiobolus disseminans]
MEVVVTIWVRTVAAIFGQKQASQRTGAPPIPQPQPYPYTRNYGSQTVTTMVPKRHLYAYGPGHSHLATYGLVSLSEVDYWTWRKWANGEALHLDYSHHPFYNVSTWLKPVNGIPLSAPLRVRDPKKNFFQQVFDWKDPLFHVVYIAVFSWYLGCWIVKYILWLTMHEGYMARDNLGLALGFKVIVDETSRSAA